MLGQYLRKADLLQLSIWNLNPSLTWFLILYVHENHLTSCLVFNMEFSISTEVPPEWGLAACLFVLSVCLFICFWGVVCYLLLLSDEAAAQAGLGTTPNQEPKPFPPKVTANILFSLPRKTHIFPPPFTHRHTQSIKGSRSFDSSYQCIDSELEVTFVLWQPPLQGKMGGMERGGEKLSQNLLFCSMGTKQWVY